MKLLLHSFTNDAQTLGIVVETKAQSNPETGIKVRAHAPRSN